MKKIILLAMAGILFGCVSNYQIITTGIRFKIPKDMPNFTTSEMIWLDAVSPYLCRVHYKNLETKDRFTLVIRCNTRHIIALIDYHKNQSDAEFYIYDTPQSEPRKASWTELQTHFAKYDPIIKQQLERMDGKI